MAKEKVVPADALDEAPVVIGDSFDERLASFNAELEPLCLKWGVKLLCEPVIIEGRIAGKVVGIDARLAPKTAPQGAPAPEADPKA